LRPPERWPSPTAPFERVAILWRAPELVRERDDGFSAMLAR
jgi:hypothetical protein